MIVCFDTETTGLQPDYHEVIEIGAVQLTDDLKYETARLSMLVKPKNIGRASPTALEINGYDAAQWASAVPRDVAFGFLYAFCRGSRPMGHNVAFDLRFVHYEWEQMSLEPPWGGTPLDTMAAVDRLLKRTNKIKSKKLADAATYYGLVQPEPHRALDDAVLTVEIARRMGL